MCGCEARTATVPSLRGGLKLGVAGFGESAGLGGEQLRRRRDAPGLPDGARPASETGGREDPALVEPLKTSGSSNPVDLGWIAVRTARCGRELLDRIDLARREAM